MRMTSTQTTCLARLVSDLRPEWDFHGVVAAVKRLNETEAATTVCLMAITAAADPTANTPAAMSNPVYRPDRPAGASANASPSEGRDNVVRLRQVAALEATRAADAGTIAQIRATSKWPRKERP